MSIASPALVLSPKVPPFTITVPIRKYPAIDCTKEFISGLRERIVPPLITVVPPSVTIPYSPPANVPPLTVSRLLDQF